ncbi:MAG: hypothetical protein R3B90_13475 [Planctomycetaceae bacterium]
MNLEPVAPRQRLLLVTCGLTLLSTVSLFAQSRSDVVPRVTRPPRPAGAADAPSFGEQVEATGRAPRQNLKTLVEFTILTPQFGGQLAAQRWAKLLSEMGVTPRMRQPVFGDELGVEEEVRGTLRMVRVTGQLNERGDLRFADRDYTSEQSRELKEWIDELLSYGALGAPAGKPLWGLTDLQFSDVYESLAKPVETEVEGLPLNEAIAKLPLPAEYPLHRLSAADAELERQPGNPVENRVQGITAGTALAIVLREYGLGFRPLRTPDGSLELAVEPLQPAVQSWPVGWELSDQFEQSKVAPKLYEFVEIGFEDAALQDVLDAAAAAIEIPLTVDYRATRATEVNLEAKLVSYPQKRTSWSLMLNSIIRKAELTKQVRTDEAGRAFVDIKPFVPTPVEKSR